tara:strand:- start:1039 stop:2178 length:1140 start_codon:yes stop_codon:yes gene_type:complete
MKKIFLVYISIITIVFCQTRYIDEIFDNVVKTENVVYGNAPDLPFIFLFEWNTNDVDLDMDIYEPEGDTLNQRPVIIFIHAGSFFSGSNEADDMVDLSIASAKRGYVAVSINYRLGLNILSSYSGERAVYRGVQDASAAIRYLRENSNLLNIDPDKIFIWGSSAGSFIGLHLAYSDDDERPESTYGNNSDPDLGCIDCEGNEFVHDSKPNGLVSCWGAIGDLDWVDNGNNVPTILFHGTLDPIVPFNSGFPFTIDIALPIVYGSNLIFDKLNQFNIESELHVGENELHEYWGTLNGNWFGGPNENYEQIKSYAYSFLYNYLDTNIIGDINQDNQVDVVDIVLLVNIILEIENCDYSCDFNNDNMVNILDVIILVNIILN